MEQIGVLHLFKFLDKWYLYREVNNTIMLVTDSKEKARFVANETYKLVNWNDKNITKKSNKDVMRIFEENEIDDGKLQIKISYYRLNLNGKETLYLGQTITNGLVLHHGDNGFSFDHTKSKKRLFTVSDYKVAATMANQMKNAFPWKEKEIDYGPILETFQKEYERALFLAGITKEEKEFEPLFIEQYDKWELFIKTWRKLNQMHGLEAVKNQIKRMMYQIKGSAILGESFNKKGAMHMIFSGNPGTGKTEVARLMASFLYCFGMIDRHVLVEADRSTIVSHVIGGTEKKLLELLEKAKNGVLFIDEAPTLQRKDSGKDYGKDAIDVLNKYMEDKRGEIVIIAAGYPKEMETFLDYNPGLRTRFQHQMYFPDYDRSDLLTILTNKLEASGLEIEDEAKVDLRRLIGEMYETGKIDGNGRSMRTYSENILNEVRVRIGKKGEVADKRITREDVYQALPFSQPTRHKKPSLDKLDQLVGLEELKHQVKTFVNIARLSHIKRKRGLKVDSMRHHMVFKGNPGTGKTTVARLIGECLKDSGLLSKGHFIETNRAGLVGKYQGHTAIKTQELVRQALGGVLFIDEAYSLYQGNDDAYGKECIDSLLSLMENHHDDLIVILAGYGREMDVLLQANPGFSSRIGHTFVFADYYADEIMEIADNLLCEYDLCLTKEADKALKEFILRTNDYKGNGRWVRNLVGKIHQEQMNRLSSKEEEELSDEELKEITREDVLNATTIFKEVKDIESKTA